jgi:hypothetical protein
MCNKLHIASDFYATLFRLREEYTYSGGNSLYPWMPRASKGCLGEEMSRWKNGQLASLALLG